MYHRRFVAARRPMDVADDGEYLTPEPPFAVHCALLSYRQGKDPVVVYSAHGEPGSAKMTRCISHRMSQKMIVFFFCPQGTASSTLWATRWAKCQRGSPGCRLTQSARDRCGNCSILL